MIEVLCKALKLVEARLTRSVGVFLRFLSLLAQIEFVYVLRCEQDFAFEIEGELGSRTQLNFDRVQYSEGQELVCVEGRLD